MRIAVLISGYLRTIELNLDSLYNNIIKDNIVDIFFHITSNDEEDKYFNKKPNINKIKDKLKPKIIIEQNNINYVSCKKTNNLLNQYYKFYILNQHRQQLAQIEGIKYDLVIKYRPDIFLLDCPNFNDINVDTVYLPVEAKIDHTCLGENVGYLSNLFAYGDELVMDKYFDLYLYADNLIKSHGLVPEVILYQYLSEFKINYQQIDLKLNAVLSTCNVIAITGDSGSGKSTLSKYLKKYLLNSFVLECDRYHKYERGDSNWKNMTHLNPDANYICKMNDDVFDLKLGQQIYQVDYDHQNGKFTEKKVINSTDNIIVCGLHTFYGNDAISDLKIFMDTQENLRVHWKIKRDMATRGYTAEQVLELIKQRQSDYDTFILPQRDKADIIIIFGTNSAELSDSSEINLKVGIRNSFDVIGLFKTVKGETRFFVESEIQDNFTFLIFRNRDTTYTPDEYYQIIVNLISKLRLKA